MHILLDAIQNVDQELRPVSETHLLDAQVLLAHILGKPRIWVLAHPEYPLTTGESEKLHHALRKLKQGIPLPYIIEHWEFYGLDFQLTTDVLIPRPETELLVEKALQWLQEHPERRWAVDIGTGSGNIAVTLATIVDNLTIVATDISQAALCVAQSNAKQHGVFSQIHFVQADLLPPTSVAFDLICANLPYVPTNTLRTLTVFGREPSLALEGGVDGLDLIRSLLKESLHRISPGGCLYLEIETTQGKSVKDLAEGFFPDGDVRVWSDLAGHERLLEIRLMN